MVDGKFSLLNTQNTPALLKKGTRLCIYTLDNLYCLNTARATTIFAEEMFDHLNCRFQRVTWALKQNQVWEDLLFPKPLKCSFILMMPIDCGPGGSRALQFPSPHLARPSPDPRLQAQSPL